MEIKVQKRDVIWSYLAQFFNLGVGFITLPAILKMLSADEVGLNYILISISSVIVLFDMGFSSQFSKNITYVLSGAQTIEKEGISSDYKDTINAQLLTCVLATAKSIYKRISWIAMLPLLTVGSCYVWKVTDNGTSIDNIVPIWGVFCASSFFNLYFLYYNSFLQGRGLVKESKQGQVYSRIVQLAITFTMLFCGCGLLSVVVANLIAPFAFRLYARYKFYDDFIKKIISNNVVSSGEIKETFKILLYNAKKMGVIGILSAALGYASTLIIGAFLPLAEVGSYGIMVQLIGIVGGVSTTFFYSLVPEFSQCLVKKQFIQLRARFGFSMFVFIIVQMLGFVAMVIAPYFFRLFGFHTQLPCIEIVVICCVYKFLEQNQSLYSQLLLFQNDLIFYHSAIWTGVFSIALQFIFLYIGWGLWGVMIAQIVPLCAYAAWKCPVYSSKKFGISTKRDIFQYSFSLIKNNYDRYIQNRR